VKVFRKRCAEGAGSAEGLTVIIDVFRAFSCAPLFFHFNAKRVLLEADPKAAKALKQEHPDYILAGEINEVPIEGGDLGNSPSRIIQKGATYFEGRTIIHRTTAGVTGAAAALQRHSEVILGAFVTAKAISTYVRRKNPDQVTLVAMGDRAERPAPEDEACADYLEHLLNGTPYDSVKGFEEVVFQPTAQKFIQGSKPYLPREDPIFCLQRDLFDFVLVAKKVAHRIEVFSSRLNPEPPNKKKEA
jgi:2-phosphosulfolactate phosphatase